MIDIRISPGNFIYNKIRGKSEEEIIALISLGLVSKSLISKDLNNHIIENELIANNTQKWKIAEQKIFNDLNKIFPNSVNCKQTLECRDNYIRESINLIDFSKIKTLVIEDISYLHYKKKGISRYLRSWRYALIFSKIKSRCEEEGVTIIKVNPYNTSRRCFKCGWISINNRNVKDAKKFKCCKCKHLTDADINAARNIKYIHIKKEIKGTEFYFNIDL